jgi:hypothetical protein
MKTKTWMTMALAGMLAAALAGCGMGKATPPPAPVVSTVTAEKPGQVVEESLVSVAATVVKVDQKSRIVTLRNAEGEVFDVQVGDEVRNLPQVKKGDEVVATYYESIAITLRKPGETKPGAETVIAGDRAKPGEKPGATVGTQTTVTATVVGINKKKGTVTLKGPKGKVVTVTARDPKRLEPVVVGDLIEVVYTEAVAISVEKPGKK